MNRPLDWTPEQARALGDDAVALWCELLRTLDDKPVSGIYIKADGSRYLAEITEGTIGPGNRLYTTEERLSVRRVGTKICRAGSPALGLIDTKMVGFVENTTDTRIQVRVVDPGTFIGQNYQGLPIEKNTIIWDDPDNLGPC